MRITEILTGKNAGSRVAKIHAADLTAIKRTIAVVEPFRKSKDKSRAQLAENTSNALRAFANLLDSQADGEFTI